MPRNKNTRVLALDPGTRETGYAVLTSRYDLITWGIKTFRRRKEPHKMLKEARDTIERIIDVEKPDVLAIETTFRGRWRNISRLEVLVEEFMDLGKKKRLKVYGFSPLTVKRVICGNGRATKRRLSKIVTQKYFPSLKRYYRYKHTYSRRHWQHAFDAVAIGLTYFRLRRE
ncbi:crossover junction endodeoxyribonuclease RuvC [candidate division WOR-3 bacterium]|nr:crossover junction endodeoxyribonuclease RuvC [candidate division WOR-3 bacterium]